MNNQLAHRIPLLSLLLCTGMITACGQSTESDSPASTTKAAPVSTDGPVAQSVFSATAILSPTKGNEANGTLIFEDGAGGVSLSGTISGLTPGKHGFHIHETGDCSADDASSAGGHFNPHGHAHGAPDSEIGQRHSGDLGNIIADAQGNAQIDLTDSLLRLDGTDSIVGRAVIVHGNADDLSSQPSGAAGPRVACGIINSAEG